MSLKSAAARPYDRSRSGDVAAPEWTNHPEGPYIAPVLPSRARSATGDASTEEQIPLESLSLSAPRGARDTRDTGSRTLGSGRLSPTHRERTGSFALSEPLSGSDEIHAALQRLSDDFPVVQRMQRINTGFYRLEGQTFELSLARNSDKLLVKLDGWNRGVRGEMLKFLQTLKVPDADASSERNASKPTFQPQERPTLPSRIKVEPVRKVAARKAVAKPAPKMGARRGGASPRREVSAREGALYVHSREPLLGDPMVAIRVIEDVEQRVVCRALCSGRITEVKASNLQALDVRPLRASSSMAALTAFEELFFVGDPEEPTQEQSGFGVVQLGQLTAQKLSDYLVDCWPPESPVPMRGLIWVLRPYFIDWLQRRQRLRLFTQLLVSMPDSAFKRFTSQGAEAPLQALMDLTERDLLVATLVSTPVEERSRLYACVAENDLPLPLAFSGLRCPCPPEEQAEGDFITSQVDRGVTVHWEAFEALLALPCERPALLSLGAQGCSQGGKSTLLRELLGLDTSTVEAEASRPPCRSPAHNPGVDLLQSRAPLGWTVDVHGCCLGDPTWMALVSTWAASSALILLHVSLEDFAVPDEEAPKQMSKKPMDSHARLSASRRVSASGGSVTSTSSTGPAKITAKAELMALLKILTDAKFTETGPQRRRILVLLRDVSSSNSISGIQAYLEAMGGLSVVPLESLQSLVGAARQRTLRRLREKLQQEMYLLGEAPEAMPCVENLKRTFSLAYDRLTLAGERPVLANETVIVQSYKCQVLSSLLDEAESRSKGKVREIAFPVSEAAAQLARLRAQEKKLLEADGTEASDTQIAELSAKLRNLEKIRKELLVQGMSPPVRFFMDTVLDGGLTHAVVSELGQCLASWRKPRLQPLIHQRRDLLEKRLQLHQDLRDQNPAQVQKELDTLSKRLAETEQASEQLSITLDTFWEEVAAISDLSQEMQGLGLRIPQELPDTRTLKSLYAQWAWTLNCPVQLLFGSPLQCAGQFLVEVLKDLGSQYHRELFVVSVIGIQSSAKSTLMNFLFGCGFATSAGRCTRGLYCSLMECEKRTLLILDTEGLMSLEAEGGGIFDAQLALMAMACSHLVIINHKGELSRQLQDLLEVCLFAMQHLKVCRIQPKLLFVLRDQHDRSQAVHGDALRLMRKHLAEASLQLALRLDELISLDPGSVFLLPSAFASDLDHTGREVRWSTELFSQEAMQLRRKIFKEADQLQNCEAAPEFSTLPDWCLHAMSVWRVLDRYGPNLLHYKTIQEIELQRELEDSAKQISSALVRGKGGLAEECQALLESFKQRLGEGQRGEKVDAEFRSSLQAILETCDKRAKAELERVFKSRKSKLPDAQKEEAKKKLGTPIEYQGELTRYTWSLCLADAVDRDQLRALKVHFKKTIEELWQVESSQSIAEQQARDLFNQEWEAFEEECRGRFAKTAKSKKQLAEEVCMVFNHVLRQHRHGDEALHVLELVPSSGLLSADAFAWDHVINYLELRSASRLQEFVAAQRTEKGYAPRATSTNETEMIRNHVVPELRRRLLLMMVLEVEGEMPSEEKLLDAMQRLNGALQVEETRFLSQLGLRLRGGRVAFLNALHLALRQNVLSALVDAEAKRAAHQWKVLQSHRQNTEKEFIEMVQRHTSDTGRAKMLAELFFNSLAREWLDGTLLAVAAEIRAQCLADLPDASGAAERAYQQAFVERNWDEVIEYVLDVNAYLHKIFSSLFEDRKVAITRVQRPQIAAQLGGFFDALNSAFSRWGREGRRRKLSDFQTFLRGLAAETLAAHKPESHAAWPILSERFPVVADFDVAEPSHFAHEFSLQLAALLGKEPVEDWVAQKLEAALQLQQAQVWALIKGCSAICPCCGSKCDRTDKHTAHRCSHHLLPAFNGWRVAGTCEAALDACRSSKNHEAPKRSDYSDHLFPNLQEYLQAEHPEWLPFPKEDRELLADSVLKAAWVNCRAPLLARYDMVDSTPPEWIQAYEESQRKLPVTAVDAAEARLIQFGYQPDA